MTKPRQTDLFAASRLRAAPRVAPLRVAVSLVAVSLVASAPRVAPASAPEPPTPSLRIVTLPAVVYPDTVVRLRVDVDPPHRSSAHVHWRAVSGVLLFDDLVETSWRSPRSPGSCTVRAAVTLRRAGEEVAGPPEKTVSVERTIRVLAPSTDGMIWIDGGSFTRGDVEGTRNTKEIKTIQNSSDEPFHEVELPGYWIDRYPVTNAAYVEYLEAALAQGLVRLTPRAVVGHFEGEWVPFYYFQSYEDLVWEYLDTVNSRTPEFLHLISWDAKARRFSIAEGHERAPVVDVSWFGAAAYARFYGKRLPSEAQWEKAARGGDTRRFPWGDHLPTALHANVNHYRGKAPTPVGSFSPEGDSPYGVGDMAAGLFEWTADWFNATYYADQRAGTPLRDPTGPFWGKAHSIRSFPSAVLQTDGAIEDAGPVSSRYHWGFEFFVRDIFANGTTTFRTVFLPPETGYEYHDGF